MRAVDVGDRAYGGKEMNFFGDAVWGSPNRRIVHDAAGRPVRSCPGLSAIS